MSETERFAHMFDKSIIYVNNIDVSTKMASP